MTATCPMCYLSGLPCHTLSTVLAL
uniref:Uncharacterized protein n=1 Tax=Arundo donax TaxID=35708 RepID=A0A0A9BIM8_ARUDO